VKAGPKDPQHRGSFDIRGLPPTIRSIQQKCRSVRGPAQQRLSRREDVHRAIMSDSKMIVALAFVGLGAVND